VSEARPLCIVGTDTGIGKTVVVAALAKAARHLGLHPLVLKPVQTGCSRDEAGALHAPDCAIYRDACPEAASPPLVLLEDACSPHLAARHEGRSLSARALAAAVADALQAAQGVPTFIEGAGGLLTPLNATETLLDALALLDPSFVLVAANRLGMLNHVLLSAECLRSRGLYLLGLVLTHPEAKDGSALERRIQVDNSESIAGMSGLPCLAQLPFIKELRSPEPQIRASGWEQAAQLFLKSPLMAEYREAPVLSPAPPLASAGLFRHKERPRSEGGAAEEELLRFDREHIWHPYSSAVAPMRTRQATGVRGTRICLRGGETLIDGMASWWCAVHGYRHPFLMRALRTQAACLPHVMFGGLTHEAAVSLARKLLEITPPGLDRLFFSDSGSVAVEVAIKMAVQYQRAIGQAGRCKLMTIKGGYHGDTLGAMSLCDPENGMHADFGGILPRQLFAPRPSCRFDAAYDPAPAENFARLLRRYAAQTAAVILEPVLQGAGGMWMYHPEYLRRVGELCREQGCLLILDEIATGFGRTGKLFACEWAGVTPDILCLGKALTGGVMSLAATLATKEVAEGISRQGKALMHGPTFMANALACALAGASLDLLSSGDWRDEVARIERALRQGLEPCKNLPGVADVRVLGAVGVLEMERPVAVEKLQDYFVRRGVWLRPFGRLIYTMPPYIVTGEELEQLTAAMRGALEEKEWE
jgi:adenosylmethionine-8-amino-7-oxononanoate aminotransferase